MKNLRWKTAVTLVRYLGKICRFKKTAKAQKLLSWIIKKIPVSLLFYFINPLEELFIKTYLLALHLIFCLALEWKHRSKVSCQSNEGVEYVSHMFCCVSDIFLLSFVSISLPIPFSLNNSSAKAFFIIFNIHHWDERFYRWGPKLSGFIVKKTQEIRKKYQITFPVNIDARRSCSTKLLSVLGSEMSIN